MAGIRLDAASVRAEILEGEYTEEEQAIVAGLGDAEIDGAIDSAVDDAFWAAYDSARSDAIQMLLRGRRREEVEGYADGR